MLNLTAWPEVGEVDLKLTYRRRRPRVESEPEAVEVKVEPKRLGVMRRIRNKVAAWLRTLAAMLEKEEE